jgi:hypothetical protein
MKIEEFEKIITDNAHKSDILQLVNNGVELCSFKDEKAEEWYDSCAKLYEFSGKDYVNFKVNIAKRLDSLRYMMFTMRRKSADKDKQDAAFQNAFSIVQKYANDNKQSGFNDGTLLLNIAKAAYLYELRKQFLQNAASEQEDCKNIIELMRTDRELYKITFTTRKGATPDEHHYLKSKRALEIFQAEFIHFFQDRFMSETELETIDENIETYKNAQKRLLHRLIYDIYLVFAKANLTEFGSGKDIYKIGEERNGKYASLKGEISEWIFNLLDSMHYLDRVKDKNIMTRKNKVDFIKDKMKEHSNHSWNDIPLSSDDFYVL